MKKLVCDKFIQRELLSIPDRIFSHGFGDKLTSGIIIYNDSHPHKFWPIQYYLLVCGSWWVGVWRGRKMLSKADFKKKFRQMLQESFLKLHETSEVCLDQLQNFLKRAEHELSHRCMMNYSDSYPGLVVSYLQHIGYVLSLEITEWLQSLRSRRVVRRI